MAERRIPQEAEQQVIDALLYQVERDHFREAYEGFNDCPADMDSVYDDKCECGLTVAAKALDIIDPNWLTKTGWNNG